jgi:hypothetical protein
MSLRSHEGYLLIDSRGTTGLTDAQVQNAGLPPGAGRGLFETATYTCSHCQFVVVMEPKRTRERAYCRGCDHLICDGCGAAKAAGAPCRTFTQLVDEILEKAERQADPASLVLPTSLT